MHKRFVPDMPIRSRIAAFCCSLVIGVTVFMPSVAHAAYCDGTGSGVAPFLVTVNPNGAFPQSIEEFDNIPSLVAGVCDYQGIHIQFSTRNDGSTCDGFVRLQLGGVAIDTAAHYYYSTEYDYGGTPLWTGHSAWQATSIEIGTVPCSTRATGAVGACDIWIPMAFGVLDKQVLSQCNDGYIPNPQNGSGASHMVSGAAWHGAAAISKVKIFMADGSNFTDGLFSLWVY